VEFNHTQNRYNFQLRDDWKLSALLKQKGGERMNQIGMSIDEHRKKQGMTQQQLADHLFVSLQAVSKWEKGQSEPDLATLRKIAELFGITVDQFLNVTPDPSGDTTEQHHHCSVYDQSFGSSAIAQDESEIICKRCASVMAQEQLAVESWSLEAKRSIASVTVFHVHL
jgi:transcriptional regulator with XRE-family HTH domain